MLSDTKNAPTSPGTYIMRNSRREIIYVGKAKNIRKRVASYTPSRPHDPKTSLLVEDTESIEYILTDNEVEALILEAKLIREHRPRYNISLKDSGSYPYIRVTIEEDFPRIFLTRERRGRKSIYLGPFTDVRSARQAAKLAREIFGIRTCMDMPRHRCLKHDTKRCNAPCIEKITKDKYRKNVDMAVSFLRGNIEGIVSDLQGKMKDASASQNYEAAKIYRDEINALSALSVRQKIESESEYNEDIVGFIRAGAVYFVQIFKIRRGVLLGRTKHEVESGDEPKKFLGEFLKQHYFEAPVPEKIILTEEPEDKKIIEKYLQKISGKKVEITDAQSSGKKNLVELLLKNISYEVGTKYDPALVELKDILRLEALPLAIECFDVSNIMGANVVGSMVRFSAGVADKSKYRRFKIRTVYGQDDVASMEEIVLRRFTGTIRRQMPLPDLVVIDGGIAQLNSARYAMRRAGVEIPIIALAKRDEEIYLPEKSAPLVLDKKDSALKLLQRIRDEAHRFAVEYHRLLRGKSIRNETAVY